jgi:AcrR family transcriptional regulator
MAVSNRVTGSRPGGRSARVRAAVLEAALTELTEVGYAKLSIEAIAERAGVHRTTIHRRWPDKQTLVLDVLQTNSGQGVPMPPDADFEQRLRILGVTIDAYLARPEIHIVLVMIVAEQPGAGELDETRRQFWTDRLRHAQEMVGVAIERGELPEGTNPADVIDQMAGPIYVRRLIQGRPMSTAEIAELAGRVVKAFR